MIISIKKGDKVKFRSKFDTVISGTYQMYIEDRDEVLIDVNEFLTVTIPFYSICVINNKIVSKYHYSKELKIITKESNFERVCNLICIFTKRLTNG